jgi:hypothetical protein
MWPRFSGTKLDGWPFILDCDALRCSHTAFQIALTPYKHLISGTAKGTAPIPCGLRLLNNSIEHGMQRKRMLEVIHATVAVAAPHPMEQE